MRRFDDGILAAIGEGKILRVRAGERPHRAIGIWAVVVERRVFVRSWTLSPLGWYRTFMSEPLGVIQIGGRDVPVRAVRTRSERLKDAVDRAYAVKYDTAASMKYVRGFRRPTRRNTTLELAPL